MRSFACFVGTINRIHINLANILTCTLLHVQEQTSQLQSLFWHVMQIMLQFLHMYKQSISLQLRRYINMYSWIQHGTFCFCDYIRSSKLYQISTFWSRTCWKRNYWSNYMLSRRGKTYFKTFFDLYIFFLYKCSSTLKSLILQKKRDKCTVFSIFISKSYAKFYQKCYKNEIKYQNL